MQVREPAIMAIAAHKKACELAADHAAASSEGGAAALPPHMQDPWWTELRLRACINQTAAQENEYKEHMLKTFKEVETTDQLLIRTIKDVFSKLAKWRVRQVATMAVCAPLLPACGEADAVV